MPAPLSFAPEVLAAPVEDARGTDVIGVLVRDQHGVDPNVAEPHVVQALQHLAPAALASIIAVELIGVVDLSNPTSTLQSVGVVLVAGAVAKLTRSMTWTVLAGVVAVLAVDLTSLA